jgi:hypothetical protein
MQCVNDGRPLVYLLEAQDRSSSQRQHLKRHLKEHPLQERPVVPNSTSIRYNRMYAYRPYSLLLLLIFF